MVLISIPQNGALNYFSFAYEEGAAWKYGMLAFALLGSRHLLTSRTLSFLSFLGILHSSPTQQHCSLEGLVPGFFIVQPQRSTVL